MSETFSFAVPAGRNVGACCSQGDLRYVTDNPVCFRGALDSTPYIMATDSRILSIISLDGLAPEQPHLIHRDACKANGKPSMVHVGDEVRVTSGKKTVIHELPVQAGSFPNMLQVFRCEMEDPSKFRAVVLNVDYLKRLAEAISPSGCLTMLIPEPKKLAPLVDSPCVAIGQGEDEGGDGRIRGIGLIVPVCPEPNGQKLVDAELAFIEKVLSQLPDERILFGTRAGAGVPKKPGN